MSKFLPERLRAKFKDPIGPVIQDADLDKVLTTDAVVVTVGDVTTEHVLKAGYTPRIAIIDGKTKRGSYESSAINDFIKDAYTDTVNVVNPAGCITDDLWNAIREAAGNLTSTLIEVDGEEDLAIIPCLIVLPMKLRNVVVLYGKPNEGMVSVRPNKALRAMAKVLFDQFE